LDDRHELDMNKGFFKFSNSQPDRPGPVNGSGKFGFGNTVTAFLCFLPDLIFLGLKLSGTDYSFAHINTGFHELIR